MFESVVCNLSVGFVDAFVSTVAGVAVIGEVVSSNVVKDVKVNALLDEDTKVE